MILLENDVRLFDLFFRRPSAPFWKAPDSWSQAFSTIAVFNFFANSLKSGGSPEVGAFQGDRSWLGLQWDCDLEEAQRAVGETVRKEVHPIVPAA